MRGPVNDDDLSLLLANWNAATPPVGGSAVPEPATLALLAVGSLALIRRRADDYLREPKRPCQSLEIR